MTTYTPGALLKFRKKPIVIQAALWRENGDHPEDACYWVKTSSGNEFLSEGKVVRYYRRPSLDGQSACKHCGDIMHNHGWIDTKEGGHIVCPGDWIITGIAGERYPCKPDIFAATYEPAENGAASPGLLEALKELLAVAKVRQCGCYVCDESIKAAEKAIAQAQEGKPNENV